MNVRIKYSVLTLIFGLCFNTVASAQIFTDRTRIELKTEPGETILETITVYNTTKEPINLKIYWQDFIYLPPFDGKKDFLPIGSSPFSLGDAVSYTPQQISLAPAASEKVNVSIQIPENAQGGGYYGVLFYEREDPQIAAGTGVKIITRLGTLFFIETNFSNKAADVKDIIASDKGLTGKFVNQGNIFQTPEATFYVLNKEGLIEDRGTIKKVYLPPSEEASFEVIFSESLSPGTYTAVITFDLKDGDSLVREADVEKKVDGSFEVLAVRN